MKNNLKIVFGCYPSFVSLYLLNLLVGKYNINFDRIIISTRPVRIRKKEINNIAGLKYFLDSFGWKFIFYQLFLSSIFPFILNIIFFFKKGNFLNFGQISKKYNIKIIHSENFNSKTNVQNLLQDEPDIFLSMGLDQILKENFINIFGKYCLNIHPSKLPDFKGVDSVFQFLLSEEKNMGVTMHEIDPEIDSGNIISRKMIRREMNDSHLRLLTKSIIAAAELFNDFLKNIDEVTSVPQEANDIKYPYKSWPTKLEIKEFNKRASYFSLKDIGYVVTKI